MRMNVLRTGGLLGILSTLSCGLCLGATKPATETRNYVAEVRRTSFGIPHIKAANEKGLGYGVGYAYAQDNFCVLAEAMVTDDGERSKYFGPAGREDAFVAANGGNGAGNLASDFYFKYLNAPASVKASWENQPVEIQDLLNGFAAGYNRYLNEIGVAKLPPACRNQPWVRTMTPDDLIRLTRRYSTIASGGIATFVRAFEAARPPTTTAAPAQVDVALAMNKHDYFSGLTTSLGSNGVALGKNATESGKGLLLANPHFPWTSIGRFYQLHLTIPGKLDVMGASLQGLPVVNIGFNANVAWTHTVNTSKHFTFFMLTLDPSDPTRYLMDGQYKAMTKQELQIESTTEGVTTLVKRTFFASEHGPIMVMPGMLDWSRERAYAIGDAAVDNDRSVRQWWAMDRASSLAEFKNSIESIVGLGWVNVLASDKQGAVYYGDVTVVPNVSTAKQSACLPEPFKPLVARGIYVLAGHVSACNWDVDPTAPQKGIVAGTKLPYLLRSDYAQNSNNSAWMTNADERLVGFPSIVSRENEPQNGRTRIGLTQITDRLAGLDGRPGNKFGLKSLQEIAFSNRAYYAKSLLPDLLTLCQGAGPDSDKGCKVLRNWDSTASIDSIGWPLFQQWQSEMIASGVSYWAVPFDPADPVNTPRGLKLSDPTVASAALSSLGKAMQALSKQGIDYSLPWGKIQMAAAGKRRIPIDGGSDMNGTEQTYNLQDSYPHPSGDGTLVPYSGSSIVLTVSYEGATPIAQGFLVPSQSSDPASAHAWDQTERFSRKQWITFPFTEKEITGDSHYSTKKISE